MDRRGMRMLSVLTAAALALGGFFACSAAEESAFIENEWNFVDASMDISGGIPENAGGVLGGIRERGVLRVATEPYFAPQEFIDPAREGQETYAGADMEMARLIAERMGVTLEIVPMEFSKVLPSLDSGECDLAISALAYVPGRAGSYTLSKGYYFSDENPGSGLIIRITDKDAITNLSDLKGRTIVAQSGSLQESQLAETITNYKEFRRVPTIRSVYLALIEEIADAGAVDIDSAAAFIEKNPQFGLMMVPGISFSAEPQFQGDRIAAKKGEYDLIYFVNAVIDEVLDTGLYDQWYEEYTNYSSK